MNRYFVNIEPIEPSGYVLTIEALPRLLIFGETPAEALRRARETLVSQLRDTIHGADRLNVELVPATQSVFVSPTNCCPGVA